MNTLKINNTDSKEFIEPRDCIDSKDFIESIHTPKNITPDESQKLEELCRYAFNCARENNVEHLKTLLDSGLNVNLANDKGDTLLMLAAYNGSLEAVQLLLDSGASVDKQNDKSLTPLSGVCFKGYYDIARLLLKSGADIHGGRLTPLNCAMMFARRDILKLFKNHANNKVSNAVTNRKKLSLLQRILLRFYGV